MKKDFLRSVLAQESRAYGFTLAFWGSGALLLDQFGIPSLIEIIMYPLGAIVGFGVLTIIAFRQAFNVVDYEEPQYLVFSMVHFISSLAPIIVTAGLLRFESTVAFFFSGFAVSTVYNFLMLFEEKASRRARKLEQRMVKGVN